MLDKFEAPSNIPESYGISIAYIILLDTTRSIGAVIQRGPEMVKNIYTIMLFSKFNFIYFNCSIININIMRL